MDNTDKKALQKALDLDTNILQNNIKETQELSDVEEKANQINTPLDFSTTSADIKINAITVAEREAEKARLLANNQYNQNNDTIELESNKNRELAKIDARKKLLSGLGDLYKDKSISDSLDKSAKNFLDYNTKLKEIQINQDYAKEKNKLDLQYKFKQINDNANLFLKHIQEDIDNAETTYKDKIENYIKNVNPHIKFANNKYNESLEFAEGLKAENFYEVNETVSDGFAYWRSLTRGASHLGDSLLTLAASGIGFLTDIENPQVIKSHFFQNLTRKLGVGISPYDYMSKDATFYDKFGINYVLSKTVESLPEMFFLMMPLGRLASTGQRALLAEQVNIAKGNITKSIMSSIEKQIKTTEMLAASGNREAISLLNGLKGLRGISQKVLDGRIPLDNIPKSLARFSKFYQEASTLGKAKHFPYITLGLEALRRAYDLASERGEGAKLQYEDIIYGALHGSLDMASLGIISGVYSKYSKSIKDILMPSKKEGILTALGASFIEEGAAEGIQTYIEQQAASNYTLPSLTDVILSSKGSPYYLAKQRIIEGAGIGAFSGLATSAGFRSVGAIANAASDAYQSLRDKQAKENMSSEQKTTQTEIDNKYIDRYKDNALVAEPVKKVKDLRDKLSNKEVELTNEKGEKVKTKLTPKVSNEQSKAKLEREINIENKNLQKLNKELQEEKAKATPNQETIKNLEEQIQKSEQAKKDLVETLNEFDRLDNITQSIRSADILDSLFKQESNNLLAEGTTIDSFNQSVSKLANAETEQEYNEAINEILSKINLPEESKKQLAKDLKQKSVSKQANKPTKEAQESKKEQNKSKDTNNNINDDIELKNDTNDNTTIKGNVTSEESNNQDIDSFQSNENYQDIDNNQTEEEVEQTEQTENIKNISSERAKEYLQSLNDGKLVMHYLSKALNNASKNNSVKELESLYHLTTVDSSAISNRGLNENTSLDYKNKSDNILKNNSTNLYMIKRDSYFYDEEGNEIHIFLDKDSKLSKSINNVTDKIKQSLNHTFKDKIKVIEQRLSKIQNKPTKQDYIDVINEIKELKNTVNKTFDEMNNDINLIKLLIASNPNTELSKDLNKFLKSVRLEIEKLDTESKQIAQYAKNIGMLNETQDSKSEVQQPFSKIATRMTQTFSRIEKLAEQAQVKYNDYLTNADENARTESFSIVSKLQELFKHIGTFFPKIANIFSITKNAKIQAVYTNILEAEAMSSAITDFYIDSNTTYYSSRLPLTLDHFHSLLYDYFKFNDDKVTLDFLINSFLSSMLKESYATKAFGQLSEQFKRIEVRVNNNPVNPDSYNVVSMYDILNLPSDSLTKIFSKDEIKQAIDKYNKVNEKKLPEYTGQDDYFTNYLVRADKLRDILKQEIKDKLLFNKQSELKKNVITAIKTNQEFIDYVSNITKAGLIVKAQQIISRTKDEYSKDESFESISLLEAQEKNIFFKLIGVENTDANLDSHFWLANFFANTYLSNLNYQGNKVFDIKLSPSNAKIKADNPNARVSNSIALNRAFVEELKVRYGNQISNFFKELNNDSFAHISNDLKSDFTHNNIPKGRLKAVKALESVRHKVDETKLVKYFNDLLGLSKEQLDSILNSILVQEPITGSEFEHKLKIMNNKGKNNNRSMERIKNLISKDNPYMYLPVISYRQSKFTGKWSRDIKYYYMPELMSNEEFTKKFKKDIDNIFGTSANAIYSKFQSNLLNFSELLYIYGNQQLNKNKDIKYHKFIGEVNFNRAFRLKYSVQPATRIYTKDIVANSITNKLLRDVIDFSIVDDINHKHKTLSEFTNDKDIYDGAFYGFLNIFAKDVDKLTLSPNNKEAKQKLKDIYDDFSNGRLVEAEAVEQISNIVDDNLNYIVVDKSGNEINLKDLYNGILARKQDSIDKFEELLDLHKAENTAIFDDHPFMAINNREIFRNYIKTGNIQDLNTSKIKVYIDGASTAIFENMIRFEGVELMNHLARTYTAEMNDHNQALTRLNLLSDKVQSNILDEYIDLLDKLGYYSKDMYDDIVAKKGLDPYILGMAMFQNQMSKFGYTNNNLFASLISQGNMFDRDNMKKLILPYLYGSTIDAVMIKALVLSIPQNNKSLYSLLEEYREKANFNNVNNQEAIYRGFINFLQSKIVDYDNLREKDKTLSFSQVRNQLNLLSTYSPKSKKLLNQVLDLIESVNPKIIVKYSNFEEAFGGYKDGVLYLDTNTIKTPDRLISVLMHELIHSINPNSNEWGDIVKLQEIIEANLVDKAPKKVKDNKTQETLDMYRLSIEELINKINSKEIKDLNQYREQLDTLIDNIVYSKESNNQIYDEVNRLISTILKDDNVSNKTKDLLDDLKLYSYYKTTDEFLSHILTEPEIINNIVDNNEVYNNIQKIFEKLVPNQQAIVKDKNDITPELRIANIYYNWLSSNPADNIKALFDGVFSFNSSNELVIDYGALDNNIGNFEHAIINDKQSIGKIPDGIFKQPLESLINYMKFFEITNRYTETKFDKNYLGYCNKLIKLFKKSLLAKDNNPYLFSLDYSPTYSFFKSLTRDMIENGIEYDKLSGVSIKAGSKLESEIQNYASLYTTKTINVKSFEEVAKNVFYAYHYTNEFLPEHNPSMNQIVTPDLIITRESSDRTFKMKNQLQRAIYNNMLRITEQVVKDTFAKYRPNVRLNAKTLELATKDASFNRALTDAIYKAREVYFTELINVTVSEKQKQIKSSLESSHLSAQKKKQYNQEIAEATNEYLNEVKDSLLKALNDQQQSSLDIRTIIMRQKGNFSQTVNALNENIFMLPDVLGLFNHNLEAAVVSKISATYKPGLQIYDGIIGSANNISKIIRAWNYYFGVYHDEVIDIPSLLTKVMNKSNELANNKTNETKLPLNTYDYATFLESAALYMIELSRKTKAVNKNIATKEVLLDKDSQNIGEEYDFIPNNLAKIIKEYKELNKNDTLFKNNNLYRNRITYNTLGIENLSLRDLLIEVRDMNDLDAANYLIKKYRDNFVSKVDKKSKESVSTPYEVLVNENIDIDTEIDSNKIISDYNGIQTFQLLPIRNMRIIDISNYIRELPLDTNYIENEYKIKLDKNANFGNFLDAGFNSLIKRKLLEKLNNLQLDDESKKSVKSKIQALDNNTNILDANVPIDNMDILSLTREEAKEIFDTFEKKVKDYASNNKIFKQTELVKLKNQLTSLARRVQILYGHNYYFTGYNNVITPFFDKVYNTDLLGNNKFHNLVVNYFVNKTKEPKQNNNANLKQDLIKSVNLNNIINTYGNEVSVKGNVNGKINTKEAERIINKAEEISLNDFVSLMKDNLNNELANSNLSIEEKNAIEQTYNALIDIVENTGNLKVYQSKEVNSQRGISVANRANRETAIILFDNQHNETPFHEYIHSLLEYAFNETSNEVSAIKNKLYSIKEQVKQELDNNLNLRQELGLSDKDYEYIFNNPEGQDRVLHEFLATFLSRPKLAAYLANKSYSPISNRLANIKGNNKIGTVLNGLKALIGILYDLFTLSAFRDRTSMLYLTNRLVRDISQYNTLEGVKAKQLAYENSKLNKANKAIKSFANAITFKIFMGIDSFKQSKGYIEQDINELKGEIYQTTQAMKNELAKYLDAMDNTTSTSKKVLLASIAVLKSLWMSRHIANNPIKRNMVITVLNDFRQRLVEGTFLDFQVNMDLGIIADKGLAKMKNGVDRILSANTSFAIEEENSAVMIRDEIKNIIYSDKFTELNKWIQENRAKDKDFDKKYETALARYIYNLKLSDYFYGVNGNISTSELQSLISRALNRGDNIVKANYKEIDYNINYIMQIIESNNALTKEMKDKFSTFLYNQTRDLSYTRLSRKHNEIGLQNSEEIFTILNKMYKSQTGKELSLGSNKVLDNSNYKAIQRKLHQLTTIQTLQMIQTHSNIHDIKYINQSMELVENAYLNGNEAMQKDIASVITLLTQIHRNSEERNNKKRILNEELAKEYYLQGKNISDRIFLDTQYKTITLKKVANYKDKLNTYQDKGYEVIGETSTEIQIRIPSVYKEVGSFDRDTRNPFYMEGYIPFARNNSEIDIVKLYTQDSDYDTNLQYYLDKGYTVDLATDNATYLKYKGFANYHSSRARLGFVFEDRIAAGHSYQMFEDFDIDAQEKSNVLSNAHYKKLFKGLKTERTKFDLDSFYSDSMLRKLAGSETITRDNISLEALEKLIEPDMRISNLFYSQEHNIFRNNTKDFINNQIFYQIILNNDTIKKRASGKYSEHHHSIKLFDIVWEDKLDRNTGEIYNAPRIKPNESILKDYGIKFSRDDLANFYRILKATNYDFNKKGNKSIYVDTRMLPMMFGFEKLTFNDVTKNGKLQKGISHTVTALRGLVKETRNNTIIRNPSLVWENFKSNIVGLIGEGIPLADIFNNIPVIIQQLREYQELHKEQKSLETRLSALARTRKQDTKIVNDLNERLANVKRNLKNHPLNYVMENGFYTNIVEDAETEGFKWDNKLLDKLQENTNISDETKSYLKDLAMTEDSNTYKLLADFTRLGDFVPRVIYYNHLIGLKGINKSKALDLAREKFVNYNTPLWSKILRNLDYFGLVNYAKYNFNIQKQILQAFTNSPIQASAVVGLNVASKTMGISPAFAPSNYLVESWLIDGNMPKGFLTGNISMFVNNLNRWNYVTP